MRVVALLTVRNEERYLGRCLEHLYSQGIEICLIDNGSTDKTLDIAQSFLGRGVFRIEHFPFKGCFELEKILLNEEKLAVEIDADWFIHHDADEIREAPSPYKTGVTCEAL
ncbi:glycosyltransferase family 2 protein [Laspinema sp. D1]|uniref:Glycosyltransferase family 2 protein n=1 Tax=Laspinema palackyanum D2a TaxID=2953684 RepID=A0ABT2MSU3_9CYAN|nr:glycosyltransferase family 2 protein [Laspinema sp. D2a]